ncbi:uncharacterized protein LOC119662321 [Teleopsis dalmanni]|uniref:uncharacterized protein LOC119662321 n=1 Tax=Teleopsis dalmanni TaxID=139649 RepID=UPI0018CE9898|nr:uncharacterized protein LOC119662321 [Teleopsis dalmanni]
MWNKIFFWIFSAYLVVQSSQTILVQQTHSPRRLESSFNSEERICMVRNVCDNVINEEHRQDQRNCIFLYSIEKLTTIANQTVDEGVIMFQKVLQNTTLINSKSSELHRLLGEIDQYVKRVKKFELHPDFENPGHLFNMTVELSDILDNFNITNVKYLTVPIEYIEAALQKNGLEQLNINFEQRFLTFSRTFEKIVDNYIVSLKQNHCGTDQPLQEWFNKFKAEKNVNNKVLHFEKFYDLY